MGKRLNIGVDVDGVVSDFLYSARILLKEMFGKPDDSAVQTSWAFDSLGITKKEENEFWRMIDTTPNWWMTHRRMAGCESLPTMCNKHRVIFITNRKDGDVGYPIEEQTAIWLKRNFNLFNPNVIISDNKGPVAAGLKLDYFIDDRPKNVEEVILGSAKTRSYLYDGTYNREFTEVRKALSGVMHKGTGYLEFAYETVLVPRVKSVDQFFQIVEGH